MAIRLAWILMTIYTCMPNNDMNVCSLNKSKSRLILGINNNKTLVITQYMDNLVSKNIKHISISYNKLYFFKCKHNQNPPWNGTSWKEASNINHVDLGWCFWCVFQGHICAQGHWIFYAACSIILLVRGQWI